MQPGDAARPAVGTCRSCRSIPFAVNRAGALRTFLSPRPVASRPIPAMSQLVADVLRCKPFDVVIASTEMMADYALHGAANRSQDPGRTQLHDPLDAGAL